MMNKLANIFLAAPMRLLARQHIHGILLTHVEYILVYAFI